VALRENRLRLFCSTYEIDSYNSIKYRETHDASQCQTRPRYSFEVFYRNIFYNNLL
jgi:hypothetical protein